MRISSTCVRVRATLGLELEFGFGFGFGFGLGFGLGSMWISSTCASARWWVLSPLRLVVADGRALAGLELAARLAVATWLAVAHGRRGTQAHRTAGDKRREDDKAQHSPHSRGPRTRNCPKHVGDGSQELATANFTRRRGEPYPGVLR
eukprot:scaffold88953_cov63-Phaeocystis_antarctica.AAC.1